jgi:hypothetical protein
VFEFELGYKGKLKWFHLPYGIELYCTFFGACKAKVEVWGSINRKKFLFYKKINVLYYDFICPNIFAWNTYQLKGFELRK